MKNKTMTYIKVLTRQETRETSTPNPNDEWDRADTETTWYIDGIEKVTALGYKDVEVAFDVKEGQEYYLVSVIYSTGDSFGHDENHSIEHIGLYEHRTMAEENAQRIRDHDNGYGRYSHVAEGALLLLSPSGTEYKMGTPWHGYFESLGYIEVTPVSLGGKRRF